MVFLRELLVYIPYYLECFLLVWMMLLPYKRKAHYRRNILILLLAGILWQVLISLMIYIDTSAYEVVVAIAKFVLCFLPLYFFYYVYHIKFLKTCYIVVIAMLLQRWSSVFADVVVSFTPYADNFWVGRVAAWLSFALLVVVVWFFYIRLINRDDSVEIDGITMALFYVLVLLFELGQTFIRIGIDERIWRLILSILELVFCIFMLSMSVRIAERNRKLAERMVSDALLAKERQQFESLKQNMEAIKSQAHDLKYVMRAMQAHGVQGEAAGKLQKIVHAYESNFNTGSAALDIILSDAQKNFTNKGIRFECITGECDMSFIDNFDLYSLLGNAFDNAAEYLSSVDGEKRYVSFSVSDRNEGFVFIEVSNYYEGTQNVYVGMKSSKADKAMHGFGTKNMRRVTEKYGGELTISAAQGVFYVTAVIPHPVK